MSDLPLASRVAAMTDAKPDIGRASALTREGVKFVANSHSHPDEVVQATWQADASQREAVQGLAANAMNQFGRLRTPECIAFPCGPVVSARPGNAVGR